MLLLALAGRLVKGAVDLTLGPDGDVYVASYKRNLVVRLDARTGDYVEVAVRQVLLLVSESSHAESFSRP